MTLAGCGICLYGLIDKKNLKADTVKCMLDDYKSKQITDSCNQYKRDFKKSFAVEKKEK